MELEKITEALEMIIDEIKIMPLAFDDKINIYFTVIKAFELFDWDHVDECLGIDPAFDAAVRKIYTDWHL